MTKKIIDVTPGPNYIPKIEAVWAFLSEDAGGEGAIAAEINGVMMPLVCSDEARVNSLRPIAQDIAVATGKKVILVKFTKREEVEVISYGAH